MLAKRFLISLAPKIKATLFSSTNMFLVAGNPHVCLYCAQCICLVFPYLDKPKHVCLIPPPGPRLTWPRTELENRSLAAAIFQAGNIPNWGTGGRRAKTKSSWKLPSLCYFHRVERWRARFRFLSSMPLVSHKDLSGLLNVEASEAELMHPVGLGSMGWG